MLLIKVRVCQSYGWVAALLLGLLFGHYLRRRVRLPVSREHAQDVGVARFELCLRACLDDVLRWSGNFGGVLRTLCVRRGRFARLDHLQFVSGLSEKIAIGVVLFDACEVDVQRPPLPDLLI